MSHSSGIPVSNSLSNAFSQARTSDNIRFVKAQIINDEIVDVKSVNSSSDWESDLSLIPGVLEADVPCYLLYRQDQQGPQGYPFILFCYVPDRSKVKDKMVYASTRANLKNQLGSSYFADEVFGTIATDFSKDGYKLHVSSQKNDALTWAEQEKLQQKQLTSGELYTGGSTTYVHGVAFPVDQAVIDGLNALKSKSATYLKVGIDMAGEKIILSEKKNISAGALSQEIPLAEARFHFFMYSHNYEGANVDSLVFLYSCPDGSGGTTSCPVKMRMLYSSSKANVSGLASAAGLTIAKMFEINTPGDISEELLIQELHPKKEEVAKTFSKPSRPGKGGARLVKK